MVKRRKSRAKQALEDDEENIELVTEDEELEKPKKSRSDDDDYYASDDEIELLDLEGRSHAITKIDIIIYIIILIVGLIVGWLVNHFMTKLDNIEHATTGGSRSDGGYMDNPENRKYFFGDKPPIPPEILEMRKQKEDQTAIGLTTHSPKMRTTRDSNGEPVIEDDSIYNVEKWIVKKDRVTGQIIDLVRSIS